MEYFYKNLFGQINSISPRIQKIESSSIAKDFEFVARMFSKTGNDIKIGISYATKPNDKKRKASETDKTSVALYQEKQVIVSAIVNKKN